MSQKNAPEAWLTVKNVCLRTDKDSGVQMAEGPTRNSTEESRVNEKSDIHDVIEANNSPKFHNDGSCLVLLPNNVESLDNIHEFPFEPYNL